LRQCRVSQLDAIGRPRLDHENAPRPSGIGNASMRGVCASPPPSAGDLENTRCRRDRDDCTIARWLQPSAVAAKFGPKTIRLSSNVRLRRVSSIKVHAGEGLLANLTAAKIRNGDLPQGRGATPDCSRRGSRATWKAGSAAHRREGFVAPPGSLARSSKTRGRARWCRPRQDGVGLASRDNHRTVRQLCNRTRLRPWSSRSSCRTASISGARGASPPFALPQAARNASASARRQKKHGR
jgi:hypothetical protein